MVAQIQSNKSAAKKRGQVSQEFARAGATNNQTGNYNANGTLVSTASPRPTVSSDQSDLLSLVTPDNAASVILAAIKVLGQEARTYTGRGLACGLSHDNFPALSRVVSALSANRPGFGY